MAITLGATPSSKTLTVVSEDWRGQRRTDRILLKGNVTDGDVIAILTELDALSNARIISATLSSLVEADGFKLAALDGVPNENIHDLMALNFLGTNPINSAKKVNKTVTICAPLKAIETASGSGAAVGDNANLNTLTAKLETNLAYLAPNGTTYGGLFDYIGGQRISGAEIVDNT